MNEHIDPARLERIRALLAVAENPATPPEAAETYTAQAMALIAKHGIDAAMLHHQGRSRDQVEARDYQMTAPWAFEQIGLLAAVADGMSCMAVNTSRQADRGVKRLRITGFGDDLDRAEMLYQSLLVQQTHGLATGRGPLPGENPRGYKRAYLVAFRTRIAQRLKAIEADAKREATAQATGTDVVLADRAIQVKTMFRRLHPRLRTYASRANGLGAVDGTAAANRADLGLDAKLREGRRAIGT
jgi:hypothetical protein